MLVKEKLSSKHLYAYTSVLYTAGYDRSLNVFEFWKLFLSGSHF